MERKLYRELWRIRFEKMLNLEKQGLAVYETLLGESRAKNEAPTIALDLERLVLDEKKHVRLVQKLIEILNRQVD